MTENIDPIPMKDPAAPAPPVGDVPPPAGAVPPPAAASTVNYATPTAAPSVYVGPPATPDDKTMGLLAHLLGIILGPIGPLIIWLMKKDTSPFVNDQGKEALNFQITLAIGYVAGIILSFFCIGFLVLPVVFIASLVFSILAALQAKDGIAYRYPFALRLIN